MRKMCFFPLSCSVIMETALTAIVLQTFVFDLRLEGFPLFNQTLCQSSLKLLQLGGLDRQLP